MTWRLGLVRSGLVALALFGCGEEPPVASTVSEDAFPDADAVMMNGAHTFTNPEGIRASVLRFDTLLTWNDSIDSEIRGVDLTIYNADGSERARVTAERGTADAFFQGFTARGDVVVLIPAEGTRIETEELVYEPEVERIRSDTCFVMTSPGNRIEGSSFVSDLEFRNFTVTGREGC